jgi:16S rRNA (guanine(1405)-N(7))-methyltransferase
LAELGRIDAVADAVLKSRRYRWLAPEVVTRLAGAEVARSGSDAEAVKRTKRRLHQIFGAYVSDLRPEAALAALAAAQRAGGPAAMERACTSLLQQHASTRERLPTLGTFYLEVFAATGTPGVLLDLACGLNPLAWPWMKLPTSTRYVACDIDRRIMQLVDGFLELCGVPHSADVLDLAARTPGQSGDVALMLKLVPCLERQAPGSARRLLAELDVRHVVVSFPTRSLGGAGKGMVAQYRDLLAALVDGLPWRALEVRTQPELVFVLERP